MLRALTRPLAAALILLAAGASAQTLALPDKLVDLRSGAGEALLMESGDLDAFLPLSSVFETQKTQAFCGVASMVMALNALHVPAPTSPEYQPYAMFTQDNVLDGNTEAILPRAVLARQGMTLDQLGGLLGQYKVRVDVHHAEAGGLESFRQAAGQALLGKGAGVVLVNYLRRSIGQERGGHISPLGAYDAKADRFLVLDVARYKYPPVWVAASDLFDAMNTTDSDNDNRTRGYVLVTADGAPTVH